MPVNIKVIRTNSFIKTAVTEVLNFAVSKQALLDIASEIQQPGEYEIWVDSREADTMLSMVNIDHLGEMLAAHPSLRESKIAFVTSVNETKPADVLETITADCAVDAKVVASFEEAITWLVMREAV